MTNRGDRPESGRAEAGRSSPAPADNEMNVCVICGARYPRGQTCPQCRPQRYRPAAGGINTGKWVTIAVLVGLFAVLMVGAYFVIRALAASGEQYGRTLHGAAQRGSEVSCAVQLAVIYRSLQVAAMSADGRFPRSLTELYSPSELHCPSTAEAAYIYVPGQDQSMPRDNVLVYESKPVHRGKCSVLRLGGKVELLTTQELAVELDRTHKIIAAKRAQGR